MYDAKKQTKKLKETADEVAEGEMPPWYYSALHRHAGLSQVDTELLRVWTAEAMVKLGR